MSRLHQLRTRRDRTLALLSTLDLPEGVRRPTGPVPPQQAALTTVLDDVTSERAHDLVSNYGDTLLRACVTDLIDDPLVLDLIRLPADLPRLTLALERLLVSRSSQWHPWDEPDAASLLRARPTLLDLHYRSALAPCLPMAGLAIFQRRQLRTRLDKDTPAEVLIDRRLAAPLLHELARGPARGWVGGWPCWTLIEAAVTHVQRRCAPAHLFPTTLGEGLAGYRHYALLGSYLSLWRGESRTWQLATAARHPHDGLGDRLGPVVCLADLQAWLLRGGAHIGPAWTSPFAWLKLIASALHGGPLTSMLRAIPREDNPSVALARATPDLLAEAAKIPWSALPTWSRRHPPERVHDLLDAAVQAMFAEDVTQFGIEAGPSDPPRGELHLDTEACTLSASPRGHLQYTEPACWLVPPSWSAALHARGLRRLTLTGCTYRDRHAVLPRLLSLAEDGGQLPEQLTLATTPRAPLAAVPAPHQLRHHNPLLALGGDLANDWARQLREAHFSVAPPAFGTLRDPLSVARALSACCTSEPLAHDLVIRDGDAFRSRWHDPTWRFPTRDDAFTTLDTRLDAARQVLRSGAVVVLSWQSAWVTEHEGDVVSGDAGTRLLSVEEIVTATEAALDEMAQLVARPKIVLAVHPSGEANLSPTDLLHSKATLALAARALSSRDDLCLLPTLELAHQGDPRWTAGAQLDDDASDALFQHFMQAWVAPDSRTWTQRWRTPLSDLRAGHTPSAAEMFWLSGHPLLPQPMLTDLAEELVSAPAADTAEEPFDADTWTVQITEALGQGDYIAFFEQTSWIRTLQYTVDDLPEHGSLQYRLDLLQQLIPKVDEVEQPDVISSLYARLLHAVLPEASCDPAVLAPLLRFALRRQWVDHLDEHVKPLDELQRERLGLALLGDRKPMRKGQVLRTPFDRAIVLLLGVLGEK